MTAAETALLGTAAVAMAGMSGTPLPATKSKSFLDGHKPKPIVYIPDKKGPTKLPIQIFKIGNFLLPAMPGEITTIAGARLCDAVAEKAKERFGDVFSHTVLAAYANDYCLYTATKEEYKTQSYEGASTLYGPHQLDAFIQEFKRILGG